MFFSVIYLCQTSVTMQSVSIEFLGDSHFASCYEYSIKFKSQYSFPLFPGFRVASITYFSHSEAGTRSDFLWNWQSDITMLFVERYNVNNVNDGMYLYGVRQT